MRRFRNILVVPVTAGAEPPPALEEAVTLAETSGASVEMLGLLRDVPQSGRGVVVPDQAVLSDGHRASYRQRLAAWVEQVGHPSLPIHIASGSHPVEVAERVQRNGHDLVVVAGDGSAESATTARRIVRASPCPVWLLRPTFTGARVLAVIDPDHDLENNKLILELARSQASIHDGDLRVAHAWDVPGLDEIEQLDDVLDRDRVSRLTAALEAAHRASFEAAIDAAGVGEFASAHLVDGPAARAVHALTELYRVDLVVMGAGAWAHPELGLGSTAEQILSQVECSVLVVR